MGRVFVTEDSRHNLAHALGYGELVILESQDYPLFTDGRPVVKRLEDKLRTFDPKEDYLLLVGDPILMALCFTLISDQQMPTDADTGVRFVRVLKWDRQANRYVPVNVTF